MIFDETKIFEVKEPNTLASLRDGWLLLNIDVAVKGNPYLTG